MKPGFRVFLSFKFLVSFTVIPLSQRSTKNNFREKDEMCDVSINSAFQLEKCLRYRKAAQ